MKKEIFLSGIWSYLNVLVKGLFALSIAILFSRFLGVKEYGYFVIGSLIINFLIQIGEVGILPFIIQRNEIDEEVLKTTFSLTFLISLFLFFLVNFFALFFTKFGVNDEVAFIIRILSLSLLSKNLLSLINSKWFREFNNKVIAQISIAAELLSLFISLILLLRFDPLIALIIYTVSKSWVQLIISLKFNDIKFQFGLNFRLAKEIIDFGFPLVFSRLITYLNSQAPKIACGFFLGPYYLGLLSAGLLIVDNLHKIILSSMWSFWMPFLARVRRDLPKRFGEAYIRIRNIQGAFLIPIFFGIISLRFPIVELFLPSNFGQISNLLPLLCLTGILFSINYLFKPILILTGKTKKRLYYDIFKLILFFLFYALLFNKGIIFILYATLIVELILFVFSQFYLQSIIGEKVLSQLSSLNGILIACTPIILYPFFLGNILKNMNNTFYLLISIPIYLISYAILIFFFDRKLFSEFYNLKNIPSKF